MGTYRIGIGCYKDCYKVCGLVCGILGAWPLPDQLLLSWDFARKARGRVAHFGSGTHFVSSYLLPEGSESTIQNFDAKDANFDSFGVARRIQPNLTRGGRRVRYNPA